jgi:hypothetical protein
VIEIDKEAITQAISEMIDDDRWFEAQRLLDACESAVRNCSVIRKTLCNATNVVSEG